MIFRNLFFFCLGLPGIVFWPLPAVAETPAAPLADVHLHWKWNQKEITSPRQAIDLLRENRVTLAVVTGTPPELALELQALAPDTVIPIYGIYRIPEEWSRWHQDPQLLERTREALQSGRYQGIGEIHLIGGFISDWRNPVISGLFELAAEFDLPVLVHTEFSRADYLIGFCQAHAETRFLWAHAGSILPPAEVRRALESCPNLWVELSARDPWRHLARRIDEDGKLKPGWRTLVMDYAERFMVGSDTVWPVEQLNPWDEPDSGWQELHRFLAFHRGWMADLPTDIARKIRLDNARVFFGRQ
ncbi:MAG: TatD family hydrolase [Gammaproteobacteria bacterium]|nr:TatD family hydrolase [Gammaproteobacteria bacterium]